MARLLHHFLPIFSFGLALDEKVAANAASDAPLAVQQHVRDLLDRARAAAAADGKRGESIEDAGFAVIAWIDEIMARNPAYLTSQTVPLQVTLYTTNNAGNEFFQHLGALKSDQDEVREVYYHALLLGFVGQYYYENGDTGELGRLKELHARQLPIAPAPVHTLREERITPQPYSGDAPAGPRYPRQWDNVLLKAGIVLALLIPLAYLAYLLIAAPKVVGPTLAEQVNAQLAGFPCADLSASVGEKGETQVAGFVSRAEDIAAVSQRVGSIEGVRAPRFDVKLRIWPHCEVVRILKPLKARNQDLAYGLSITPSTGHSDRFIQNENVITRLVQGKVDGYLYVDYYTVSGQVAHMYPNPLEPNSGRVIRSGEQFDVGAAGQSWTVDAPYGQELIVVMSSPTPLYQDAPPQIELAKDYLPRLEQLLKAHKDTTTMAADFMFMQTEPAP